jgi:hypothetical protein
VFGPSSRLPPLNIVSKLCVDTVLWQLGRSAFVVGLC